ncbi:hypothetical protein BJV78DRAFT_173527 [Lactifluus subvellereus]|nr:hypothetical protein BJV78DRAFT_173527 [Lactifluus subvellereus]
MQLPTAPGSSAEIESEMERLDISRDRPEPQQQQPHSHPEPPNRPGPATPGPGGGHAKSESDQQHHHRSDPARTSSQHSERGAPKSSQQQGEVWYLKTIDFTSPSSGARRQYNVITQNYNGPCSFIAICNILILREQIQILPRDRKSVTYDFLAQLVGEHILLTAPRVDVSAALAMMPLTTRESHRSKHPPLKLTHARSCSRRGHGPQPALHLLHCVPPRHDGGELALFASAGIGLVHGWLVDPASPEFAAVSRVEDYDSAVNLIVEADVLTRGQLVGAYADQGEDDAGPSQSSIDLTEEERRKVEDAVAIRTFLDHTRSQLTYHGLFALASLPAAPTPEPTSSPSPDAAAASAEPTPPPHPELFALFRNSHLAVLYRHAGALYTLVTDQVFLNEPSVVWERLEDVDQGAAVFVDSVFERATPVGGDWAGLTISPEALGTVDPADRALALQLQSEEDARVQRAYAKREEERAAQRRSEHTQQRDRDRDERYWQGQRHVQRQGHGHVEEKKKKNSNSKELE